MDGGYCFHPSVCLFVCEQYYGKTQRISTKLGGWIRYGPRIMLPDFGLGPKSNMAAMAAILKKYLNFFFCISTCFKWFPTVCSTSCGHRWRSAQLQPSLGVQRFMVGECNRIPWRQDNLRDLVNSTQRWVEWQTLGRVRSFQTDRQTDRLSESIA